MYSISGHFGASCNVLLTGASGYIGSLVLEKLLRSTNVGHVYVLLRTRRGASPAERVAKLLQGPLFHLIGEEQASRVTAVAGDILQPGLGLSPEDEAMLVERVDTVIHSAADIRLDAPIHETLKANYLGSCMMAGLSSRMARLRSFVYVSTCYVNINKPPGFQVEERMYPLLLAGKEVDVSGIAQELLALPVEDAEALAAKYIDLWGFKNTYAMGKNLAEKAVAELSREHDLPLCIVRPALVSAVAAEPYPGYTGNFAGQVGGALSYLVGFYDDQPAAVATNGSSVWDVVPGDVVAHAIIAAAAAAAVPAVCASIMAPLLGPGARAPAAGDGDPGRHLVAAGAGARNGQVLPKERHPAPAPVIVQVGSSCTYPLSTSHMFNDAMIWCMAHPRPFTLALGRRICMSPKKRHSHAAWRWYMVLAMVKVAILAFLLNCFWFIKWCRKLAKMLTIGLRSYETINDFKYNLQLFFSAGTLVSLEEALDPRDSQEFMIVWRPPPADQATYTACCGAAEAPAGPRISRRSSSSSSSLSSSGSARDTDMVSDADAPVVVATVAPKIYGTAAADRAGSGGAFVSGGAEATAAARQAALEGGWTRFHCNMLAYLYQRVYSKQVPADVHLPMEGVRRMMPHLTAEEAAAVAHVQHNFSFMGY